MGGRSAAGRFMAAGRSESESEGGKWAGGVRGSSMACGSPKLAAAARTGGCALRGIFSVMQNPPGQLRFLQPDAADRSTKNRGVGRVFKSGLSF